MQPRAVLSPTRAAALKKILLDIGALTLVRRVRA